MAIALHQQNQPLLLGGYGLTGRIDLNKKPPNLWGFAMHISQSPLILLLTLEKEIRQSTDL
ncbi:hypothetical protein [Oscillatoria acuminata]|uniref:hypothetical protein n=1 Tax=Oscillatoria acuminata TaxID=118323 RepID=UPI0002E84416|nr:hypothetical protein [Oscillatoria acuminata]